MHTISSNNGQSLIEILFAIALFTIGVITVGYVLFDAFDSLRYGTQASQARMFAQEGIEAVRELRDTDTDLLQEGVFGISLSEEGWELVPAPDTFESLERSIFIEETEEEVYQVRSVVTWADQAGGEKYYELQTLLTNWNQTQGQAGDLGIDVGGVSLNASSTELSGITLYNAGEETLVIDSIRFYFEADASLSSITLGGETVYASASSTLVSSGEYIDIPDYSIAYASGVHSMSSVVFDAPISATDTLLLTIVFIDGSNRHITLVP